MSFLSNLPIRRKLTFINILTSGGALLLVCAVLVAYEQHAFRQTMERDLGVTAQMAGLNCASALAFNDSKSAEQTLRTLAAHIHVTAACLYDTSGSVFAVYQRTPGPQKWPAPGIRGTRYSNASLEVTQDIDSAGETLGQIYLQSDLQEIGARWRRYSLVVGVVLLVAILLAWLIGSRLQRVISEPLAELAAIAHRVATKQDYSARALNRGEDELGSLIVGFNYMLDQIQAREADLNAARASLEQRVEERTAALQLAQAAAMREQERFKLIFESVPVGISYYSGIGTAAESSLINDAHLRICGLTREQAADQSVFKRITHPEDVVRQKVLERTLLGGQTGQFSFEKRYLRLDGTTVWVVFSTQHRRNSSGTMEHVTTVVDITALKQAQEVAATSAAQLRFVFEAVPVGVTWIYRHADHIESMINASFYRICGLDEKKTLHFEQIRAITHPDDLRRQDEFRAQLERGEIDDFAIEKRYVRPDGGIVWVVLTIKVFRGADGAILQEVSTAIDISERKQAEINLEQLHRQLIDASRQAGMAEVATGVLHNVGNVLNSVNVSATLVTELVRRSKAQNLRKVCTLLDAHPADLGAYLTLDAKGKVIPSYLSSLADNLGDEHKAMITELEHLRKNIEHIKDIVAMQQNYAKTSGVTETVSVPDLVEDALRMNAGSLARHDVDIVREYAARPVITLDKHKVLQIVVNLVRNAKYACDESGRTDKIITVRITAGEKSVSISIADNGVGIPPQNLTRIFAHGFTTREHGHGFGLHSGALAAKELGGSLTPYSAGVGHGATFTLQLPYAREAATS